MGPHANRHWHPKHVQKISVLHHFRSLQNNSGPQKTKQDKSISSTEWKVQCPPGQNSVIRKSIITPATSPIQDICRMIFLAKHHSWLLFPTLITSEDLCQLGTNRFVDFRRAPAVCKIVSRMTNYWRERALVSTIPHDHLRIYKKSL